MMNRSHRLRTPVVTGNIAVTKPCPKPVFQAPDGLLLLVTKPRPKQRYYYIGAGQAQRSVAAGSAPRKDTTDDHSSAGSSARLSAARVRPALNNPINSRPRPPGRPGRVAMELIDV